jgi:hypothetical protein
MKYPEDDSDLPAVLVWAGKQLRKEREVATRAVEVCKLLDSLDWVLGYEMNGANCGIVDKAMEKARKVLKDVEKLG